MVFQVLLREGVVFLDTNHVAQRTETRNKLIISARINVKELTCFFWSFKCKVLQFFCVFIVFFEFFWEF